MPTKLGQNFLKNSDIVKKIVAAADLKADDLVVEIGPGKGILTEELAKYAGKVVAVELDEKLCKLLLNKFSNNKNIEIIEGDILKRNISGLLGHWMSKSKKTSDVLPTYKVIANLPYYITSPIIRLFLESDCPPTEMILMVQKEVAERITAKAGQMSILAVSVQYYADAEILFEVGKENFDPIPKVNSAIVKIAPHSSSPYQGRGTKGEGENTKNFFKIVRAGFSAKRKTLVNNLSSSLHLDKNLVEEKIKSLKIKSTARAQELSVEDWKKMVEMFP
ncbi:MAG: 16S rRNA (adenine(1518)-N(6)/adenine(1519)-N(6))-dimethyltransferase RsmA [Parcubacteria group bacterium]